MGQWYSCNDLSRKTGRNKVTETEMWAGPERNNKLSLGNTGLLISP
jgi:hypothetical protein